ncbi:rhodanese-like domain-containing protein [Enteractinococcus fodinae]
MGHMNDFETLTVNDVPDDADILDVRDPYEFDAGHIPGALNIPLDQLPLRIDELDPDTDYFVICRTGGRSARATQYMEMHGYSAVNVAGGCGAWLEADKPLVSETGADPIVR